MSNTEEIYACANSLIEILNKQYDFISLVKNLAIEQKDLILQHKDDDLLCLLAKKQDLIVEYGVLAKEAQIYFEKWANYRDMAPLEIRKKIEDSWDKLKFILSEIMNLEDDSKAILQNQKQQTNLEIGKIQKGKVLNKAYGASVSLPPPRFRDQEG